MTEETFCRKIFILAEVLQTEISEQLVETYWTILKDYSNNELERMFDTVIRTCKFFPKPSELIEIIEGSQSDKSLGAWVKVVRAIEQVGYYSSPKFDDQLIHFVIEQLGGWMNLCTKTIDELKWTQKEFERLYSYYKTNTDAVGYISDHLIGFHESENAKKGYDDYTSEPILIGTQSKLQSIIIREKRDARDSRTA